MKVTFDEWAELTKAHADQVRAYVNALHRRVEVLENVIAENFEVLQFEDEATAQVVADVCERKARVEQH